MNTNENMVTQSFSPEDFRIVESVVGRLRADGLGSFPMDVVEERLGCEGMGIINMRVTMRRDEMRGMVGIVDSVRSLVDQEIIVKRELPPFTL